jgi:hypothetical protein
MTTLKIDKTKCVNNNFHTPNRKAISIIAHNFDCSDYFTFCEVCEQNISAFSFYDEDRGDVLSKWSID